MNKSDREVHDLELMKGELLLNYNALVKDLPTYSNPFRKQILKFAVKKMYLRIRFLDVEIEEVKYLKRK